VSDFNSFELVGARRGRRPGKQPIRTEVNQLVDEREVEVAPTPRQRRENGNNARSIHSSRHASWGSPPLPDWVKGFRGHQVVAIDECVEGLGEHDVVILNAPTGTGKTLIAEAVRRRMGLKTLYVCSSKTLQDQFLEDFDYAKVLKGRANYGTLFGPSNITAGDCTAQGSECDWCVPTFNCPYQVAKRAAKEAELAVVNTAYFMAEANYVGGFSDNELVVVDECDVLEDELMGFVQYTVTKKMLWTLGLDAPKKGTHKATIIKWLDGEVLPAAVFKVAQLKGETAADRVKQRTELQQFVRKTRVVVEQLREDEDNWVRDNNTPMTLKPVKVDQFGKGYLWRHGKKWLIMSATVISPDELVESLGLEEAGLTWTVVNVPMTFPVENRRIHVAPVANMVSKEKATAWPAMAEGLKRVLDQHPGERVLVHTVSYELATFLCDRLAGTDRPCLVYGSSSERDATVARFRATRRAVLFAPSLDRGVDFKGDDCRVVVVAKIPFPNLGDPQISSRMRVKGGQTWYATRTIRSLVQMMGRAVRSEDDYAHGYILDRQFPNNVLKNNKRLLPNWWMEALNMRFNTKRLLDGREQ
jgi:ATP-dependent DNA helicase DinG